MYRSVNTNVHAVASKYNYTHCTLCMYMHTIHITIIIIIIIIIILGGGGGGYLNCRQVRHHGHMVVHEKKNHMWITCGSHGVHNLC